MEIILVQTAGGGCANLVEAEHQGSYLNTHSSVAVVLNTILTRNILTLKTAANRETERSGTLNISDCPLLDTSTRFTYSPESIRAARAAEVHTCS